MSQNNVSPDSTHTVETFVHHDPWEKLRQFTNARIGIGRVGTSIPTSELLRFQLSHAQAIDAVHVPLDTRELCAQLESEPRLHSYLPAFELHSEVQNRMEYLQRPDYGRRLNEASFYQLQQYHQQSADHFDLAIVIADGLSSYAISHHAAPFLTHLIRQLHDDPEKEWHIAPLCIVKQGRVAIGDDVGEALNAKEVLVLVGERPGLSSPDSMGLYLTWHPHRGMEDSLRNCISNVRPEGLDYQRAAHKCLYLLKESHRIRLTGVGLKDRSEDKELEARTTQAFCLVHTQ
ncbi:ethanolamine ammonia-lyase subunit EutC [Vibrio mangrovi]|uniref:Ethanolamine ammonia-lyase small subunit n=1 Tax=Vibrio mangrovi TaxID=474394 RepID=A0A1Y6IXE3_9VIBR|nr:ethanolamine ammonia-lyase subunit EutC [Vibrio mangrovi]MDW6005534.1 ethanolamine ammonia-lyase subunit EutC [Vibrio mangrovi]SMS00703.1 Ethanolamine ammonia-lyase light chain [Vibrio mangrovi]